MVKRLKAILLLTLMLGSARFAKAEAPKGEAHVSNKTNIETQAPVEDASLENDIVKVNEATGEEVIVAQEENELDAMLAQFQSEECRQIVSLAYEIAKDKEMGNEPQFTDKEIEKVKKDAIKTFSETTSLEEKDIAGILLGSYIFNLSGLSREERQKLLNKIYSEDTFADMYDLIFYFVRLNVYSIFDPGWGSINLNIFSLNPKHTALISEWEKSIAQYGTGLKEGKFDLQHHQELMGCYNLCASVLQGTDIGILMEMIVGNKLSVLQFIYLTNNVEENKTQKYLNIGEGIFDVPSSSNPTPIEQMIIDCNDLTNKCSIEAIGADIGALFEEIKVAGK